MVIAFESCSSYFICMDNNNLLLGTPRIVSYYQIAILKSNFYQTLIIIPKIVILDSNFTFKSDYS